MKWWGWGDPARPPSSRRTHSTSFALSWASRGSGSPAGRLEDVRLGDARPPRKAAPDADATRSGTSGFATTASAASRTRPARAIRISSACARATPRRRPTRSCTRATRRRSARVLDACASSGIAVVPFGGGTSVVGGVEPLRDGLAAVDLARPGADGDGLAASTTRSLTADFGPGLRGPQAEAGARRARADARAFPAVVRVRDGRRLGRDPLRRPGLDRLREHREARLRPALRRTRAARSTCPRSRRPPPDPGSASSWSAPRACSA